MTFPRLNPPPALDDDLDSLGRQARIKNQARLLLQGLRKTGPTPETLGMLKTLKPDITPENINSIFGSEAEGVRQRIQSFEAQKAAQPPAQSFKGPNISINWPNLPLAKTAASVLSYGKGVIGRQLDLSPEEVETGVAKAARVADIAFGGQFARETFKIAGDPEQIKNQKLSEMMGSEFENLIAQSGINEKDPSTQPQRTALANALVAKYRALGWKPSSEIEVTAGQRYEQLPIGTQVMYTLPFDILTAMAAPVVPLAAEAARLPQAAQKVARGIEAVYGVTSTQGKQGLVDQTGAIRLPEEGPLKATPITADAEVARQIREAAGAAPTVSEQKPFEELLVANLKQVLNTKPRPVEIPAFRMAPDAANALKGRAAQLRMEGRTAEAAVLEAQLRGDFIPGFDDVLLKQTGDTTGWKAALNTGLTPEQATEALSDNFWMVTTKVTDPSLLKQIQAFVTAEIAKLGARIQKTQLYQIVQRVMDSIKSALKGESGALQPEKFIGKEGEQPAGVTGGFVAPTTKGSVGQAVAEGLRSAKKLNRELYVFPTADGMKIGKAPPPFGVQHIIVRPDGTHQVVQASTGFEAARAAGIEPAAPQSIVTGKPIVNQAEATLSPAEAPQVATPPVKPPTEPPKVATAAAPRPSGPPIDQAKKLQSDLEADIKVARETTKGRTDPLAPLARLSLRDADRLLKRSQTLIKRIEGGMEVSEDEILALKDRIASLKDWQRYTVSDAVGKSKSKAAATLSEELAAGRDRIASIEDYYRLELKETAQEGVERLQARTESLTDFMKNRLSEEQAVTKEAAETIAHGKKRLTDFIQANLPLRERGKLLDAVANVNSDRTFADAVERVARVAEAAEKRNLRVEIIKELRSAQARKFGGITKGKYTADIQARLDTVRHNLSIDRAKAQAQIEENIQRFTRGDMAQEAMLEQNELLDLAGFKGQTISQLEHTLEAIQTLKKSGQLARSAKFVQHKLARERHITDIVADLTGGKGTKTLAESLPPEATAANDTLIGKVFNRNYSFGSLMEKVSKYSKMAPRQSELARLDQMAFAARQAENTGLLNTFADMQKAALDIFKAKNRSELSRIWREMTHEKVSLKVKLVDPTEGPKWVDLNLTRGQLMKKYQEMLDPTLDKTFSDGMHWGYEARNAVIDALTAEEKAWAEFQMDYYQKYWDSIDAIYADKYGVHLGHNPYYSPIRRDIEAEIPEDLLVYEDLANYGSVLNGSLKARVASQKPLKFTDANEVFVNHIQQMEHFKAWVNTMSELRSIFGAKEVRDAVTQYHGRDILGQIDTLIDRFARAGVDRQHTVHALDVMRANFSRSILGLKPNIALQQLTTLPMYLSEMSVKELSEGIFDFYKNPIRNMKKAMESGYLKARYTQGIERDIAAAKRMNIYRKAFSGQGSVKDWTYALMETGDKFGVIPGWWAKYKAALKQGLSDVDAMREAGMTVDRTQNTAAIDTLSSLQSGGSFWKAMTMFQNQPNKYFQVIANNLRDLRYHRGSAVKAAASVALAWAFMPALFQFVGDGFQFKKERQARAVLLGPVNDLLVIGQIAQNLGDKIAGETFDYQPSPATSVINDTGNLISKVRGIWNKWQNPEKQVTVDDMVSFFENFAKTLGEGLGIPTPYLLQVEKALRKGQPENLLFSEWAMGEPPPLEVAKQLIAKAMSNLGQTDRAGLDEALKGVTNPDRIAELNKKTWLYDTKSLVRDLRYSTQNLNPKDRTAQNFGSFTEYYWSFEDERDYFYKQVPQDEEDAYLKDHPDFAASQIVIGKWSTIPDLKTAEAVEATAKKYGIPLPLIPAFQPDTDGTERFPSDKSLWKPYFDYYALPGSSYLNMTQQQVDAGKLPDKYLKEWTTYHALKTDTAKTAFRNAHKEVSKATWRDDFRKANRAFDQWLQQEENMKPLAKKKTTGSTYQASTPTGAGSRLSFGGAPSRRRASVKVKFPKARMARSIRAPSAPRV